MRCAQVGGSYSCCVAQHLMDFIKWFHKATTLVAVVPMIVWDSLLELLLFAGSAADFQCDALFGPARGDIQHSRLPVARYSSPLLAWPNRCLSRVLQSTVFWSHPRVHCRVRRFADESVGYGVFSHFKNVFESSCVESWELRWCNVMWWRLL